MQVRADVDAARAQARLGDRGVGGLEVGARELMPGALAGTREAGQARRRALRELARKRAPARALFCSAGRASASAPLAERSPQPPAQRQRVGEGLGLLAPHALQAQRHALGLELHARDV